MLTPLGEVEAPAEMTEVELVVAEEEVGVEEWRGRWGVDTNSPPLPRDGVKKAESFSENLQGVQTRK